MFPNHRRRRLIGVVVEDYGTERYDFVVLSIQQIEIQVFLNESKT